MDKRPYYNIDNNARTMGSLVYKFVCLQITSSFLSGLIFLYNSIFISVIISRLQMFEQKFNNILCDCLYIFIIYIIISFFLINHSLKIPSSSLLIKLQHTTKYLNHLPTLATVPTSHQTTQ